MSSSATADEARSSGSGDSTVTIIPGIPKPKPDVDFIDNRGFATDESAWEDGKVKLRLVTNKRQNQFRHHTSEYGNEIKELVVRRGDVFVLGVHITGRDYNKDTDYLKLIFSTGKGALESKGTVANLNVFNEEKDSPAGKRWKACLESVAGDIVSVRVTSPCDAIVGAYTVLIKLFSTDENGEEVRYLKKVESPIYLLFNAWNKDDQVFMRADDERREYVLNDTGRVYQKGYYGPYGKPWNFGQFDKHCLEAAVYLLEKSYLDKRKHGNATYVSRVLTCMANSCNRYGVLAGNWSGDYEGGTSPSEWNGSSAILEEYMRTKQEVSYGQCWVFSGLMTTLCRTIGIPARSVTNFASAHDTDSSMTIDNYFNEDLEPLEGMNGDSVWNFHVWNEGWFTRPDLPKGNGGWQAFDGTPQESSDYRMQCGPAPVSAIKEGNVYLGYDAKFIFAEVNGDRIAWIVKSNGDLQVLKNRCNFRSVGKDISTKRVLSTGREDVTEHYKYTEGSTEERAAVARASEFSSLKSQLDNFYEEPEGDVLIDSGAECLDNGDIHLKFNATNTGTESRQIIYRIRTSAVYYTGVVGNHLHTKRESMTLDPGEKRNVNLTLPAEGYLNVLKSDADAKINVSARVNETKQLHLMEKTLKINKPDLILEVGSSTVKVGENVDVKIVFENPLDCKLTNAVIRLEGPGIQKDRRIAIGDIEARERHEETVTLTPKYAGKRELIACLNSRQLTNVNGVIQITVIE